MNNVHFNVKWSNTAEKYKKTQILAKINFIPTSKFWKSVIQVKEYVYHVATGWVKTYSCVMSQTHDFQNIILRPTLSYLVNTFTFFPCLVRIILNILVLFWRTGRLVFKLFTIFSHRLGTHNGPQMPVGKKNVQLYLGLNLAFRHYQLSDNVTRKLISYHVCSAKVLSRLYHSDQGLCCLHDASTEVFHQRNTDGFYHNNRYISLSIQGSLLWSPFAKKENWQKKIWKCW